MTHVIGLAAVKVALPNEEGVPLYLLHNASEWLFPPMADLPVDNDAKAMLHKYAGADIEGMQQLLTDVRADRLDWFGRWFQSWAQQLDPTELARHALSNLDESANVMTAKNAGVVRRDNAIDGIVYFLAMVEATIDSNTAQRLVADPELVWLSRVDLQASVTPDGKLITELAQTLAF